MEDFAFSQIFFCILLANFSSSSRLAVYPHISAILNERLIFFEIRQYTSAVVLPGQYFLRSSRVYQVSEPVTACQSLVSPLGPLAPAPDILIIIVVIIIVIIIGDHPLQSNFSVQVQAGHTACPPQGGALAPASDIPQFPR